MHSFRRGSAAWHLLFACAGPSEENLSLRLSSSSMRAALVLWCGFGLLVISAAGRSLSSGEAEAAPESNEEAPKDHSVCAQDHSVCAMLLTVLWHWHCCL